MSLRPLEHVSNIAIAIYLKVLLQQISPLEDVTGVLDPPLTTEYYFIILKQYLLFYSLNFGSETFWRYMFFD